jgi:hypothetical protein
MCCHRVLPLLLCSCTPELQRGRFLVPPACVLIIMSCAHFHLTVVTLAVLQNWQVSTAGHCFCSLNFQILEPPTCCIFCLTQLSLSSTCRQVTDVASNSVTAQVTESLSSHRHYNPLYPFWTGCRAAQTCLQTCSRLNWYDTLQYMKISINCSRTLCPHISNLDLTWFIANSVSEF